MTKQIFIMKYNKKDKIEPMQIIAFLQINMMIFCQ